MRTPQGNPVNQGDKISAQQYNDMLATSQQLTKSRGPFAMVGGSGIVSRNPEADDARLVLCKNTGAAAITEHSFAEITAYDLDYEWYSIQRPTAENQPAVKVVVAFEDIPINGWGYCYYNAACFVTAAEAGYAAGDYVGTDVDVLTAKKIDGGMFYVHSVDGTLLYVAPVAAAASTETIRITNTGAVNLLANTFIEITAYDSETGIHSGQRPSAANIPVGRLAILAAALNINDTGLAYIGGTHQMTCDTVGYAMGNIVSSIANSGNCQISPVGSHVIVQTGLNGLCYVRPNGGGISLSGAVFRITGNAATGGWYNALLQRLNSTSDALEDDPDAAGSGVLNIAESGTAGHLLSVSTKIMAVPVMGDDGNWTFAGIAF